MRPMKYTPRGLQRNNGSMITYLFELTTDGLNESRFAFNCEVIYKKMAEAGVLNRGSDCDEYLGMFNLEPISNHIPYVWSLPHYYLVETKEATMHPRNNLIGFVTPSGDRYRDFLVIEHESGRVLSSMQKGQI